MTGAIVRSFTGVVLENGAGAQQSDRRGGQEQRAIHPSGVRGGRGGRVRRGRLQAPRVRAPQTFHARHTQAGSQVLHMLVVAHHRRLQRPVHVGSTVGVFRRSTGIIYSPIYRNLRAQSRLTNNG